MPADLLSYRPGNKRDLLEYRPKNTARDLFSYGIPTQRTAPSSRLSQVESGDSEFTLMSPIKEFGKGLWGALSSSNFDMLGNTIENIGVLENNESIVRAGWKLQEWAKSGEGDPPVSWEEAEGILGKLSYAGGLTGSGLGSTLPVLAAGAAGFAAGGPVGAGVAAFAVGSALNTGETFSQLKREGVEVHEAAKWAMGIGQAISVIDTIGLGRVVGATVAKEIKGKAIKTIVKQFAKGYARGATEEGVTEIIQSGIRETTAAHLTGNSDWKNRIMASLEEGLAGALTGGLISGTGRAGRAGLQIRKTIAERAGEDAAAKARENATPGDPLGPLIESGERVVAENTAGREATGESLKTYGIPSAGTRATYRRANGSESIVTIKGLISGEEMDGVQIPDILTVDGEFGIEEVTLPLSEGESFGAADSTEQIAATADRTRFEEDVRSATTGLPDGTLENELAREGITTLESLPVERRQPLLKTLKEQAKALQKESSDTVKGEQSDAIKIEKEKYALIEHEQAVEDAKAKFPEVGDGRVEEIESEIREKMGVETGAGIPATGYKAYLTLLKSRMQAEAVKVQKAEEPSAKHGYVKTRSGATHPVVYEVVEGDTLQASHLPSKEGVGEKNPKFNQKLQARDLSHPDEQEKIRAIAREPNPDEVAESVVTDVGAPIAGQDNQLEVGRSRYLAEMLAYELGTAGGLRKQFEKYGGERVRQMKKPILIRRRMDELSEQERVDFTREGDVPAAARLGSSDQAMSDAGQIEADMLSLYRGGSVTSPANREFLREFIQKVIPKTERKEFTTDQGDPDTSGIARMESALMAYAYGSKSLVTTLKSSNDPFRKSIRNVLVEAAPGWAKMKGRIQEIDASQDISKNLEDAVNLIRRKVSTGASMRDIFAQRSLEKGADPLIEGKRGAINKAVLGWFFAGDPLDRDAKMSSQIFSDRNIKAWIERVDRYNPGQGGMFGGADAAPVDALLAGDALVTAKESDGQPQLIMEPTPKTEDAIPGTKSTIPETKSAIPETKSAISETKGIISETKGTIPKKKPRASTKTGKKAAVETGAQTGEQKALDKQQLDALRDRILEVARKIVPKAKVDVADTDALVFEGQVARGLYEKGLIEIAIAARNPEGTLHHEAMHFLQDMGMFTAEEWNALTKKSEKGGWVKKHEVDKFYRGEDADAQTREAIAFAYEAWKGDRMGSTLASPIRRAFIRIQRFLRRLGERLRGDKSFETIFEDIESGEIGAREAVGQPTAKTAARVETEYQIGNEAAAAEFKESKRGIRERESIVARTREWSKNLYQGFMRVHKDLPNTPEFAKAHDWLRKYQQADELASEETIKHLKLLTDGLDAKQMDLTVLKVFWDSFADDVRAGKPIPMFDTAEEFKKEYAALNKELQKPKHAALMKRIRRRTAYVRNIAKRGVEAELYSQEAVAENKHYITHRVIEYAQKEIKGTSGALNKPRWARKMGTRLAINMNIFEAEAQWLKRTLVDLKGVETLAKLKKEYDVHKSIVQTVAKHKQESVDKNVMAEIAGSLGNIPDGMGSTFKSVADFIYSKAGKKYKEGVQNLPFFGALDSARQSIARYSGNMSSLLSELDPDLPKEFRDASESLQRNIEGDSEVDVFPFVAWMAEGNLSEVSEEFTLPARGWLAQVTARRQVIKQKIGNDWISTQDIDSSMKKLRRLGYEGFEHLATYQPDKGNLIYTATTLEEKAVTRLHDHMAEVMAQDPQVASLVDREVMEEVVHSLKTQTIMGGPKYQMVMDLGIVKTLDSFRDTHLETQIGGLNRKIVKAWKGAVLFLPHKFIKYTIRNMSGDVDRVNAGMGFKGINPKLAKNAAHDIYRYEVKDEKQDAEYVRGKRDAVLTGGFSVEVFQDKQREVEGYFSDRGKIRGWSGKAWNAIIKTNAMRENVMRLAVYRVMNRRLDAHLGKNKDAAGNTPAPTPENIDKFFDGIGYGFTNRETTRELGDWESVVAVYARETLGDYGNISVNGRWLRERAYPFWSWKEIVLKGYGRLSYNIYQEYQRTKDPEVAMRMAKAGLATGAKKAAFLYAKMFSVYAAVSLWNNLLFGDEEEELSDVQRRRLHLTLGRWGGEIITIPTPGAMSDLLQWVGFEDVMAAFSHILNGRGTMMDVMEAVGSGFVNTVAQGITPIGKVPVELVTGREYFPDVLHSRPIKDRWHHIQRAIAIDKPVEMFGALTNSGRPTQGIFHLMASTVVDVRHVGYSAYSHVRSLAYQWKSHTEGEDGFAGAMTERAVTYYNYRLARRFGDEAAVGRAKKRMKELRITGDQRNEMLLRAKPLGMLNKKQGRIFRRTLNQDELRKLRRAERYWRDVYGVK